MFLGMLLATTAFTVLTGAADTSRLVVRGEVAKNFRPAYDILVRPQGAATKLESEQGLVRESYLSGENGGITLEQYATIKALGDVDIAAPAAILGYAMQNVSIPIDLSRYAGEPGSGRKVLRIDVARKTDAGLTNVPGERTAFVYITDDTVTPIDIQSGNIPNPYGPTEVVNGRQTLLCPHDSNEVAVSGDSVINGPFSSVMRTETSCWQRGRVGVVQGRISPEDSKSPKISIPWSFPYLVAAIDPEAEAALVGLDESVTNGRYLEEGETWTEGPGAAPGFLNKVVPMLLTSQPFAQGSDEITVSSLGQAGVAAMTSGTEPTALRDRLLGMHGGQVGRTAIDTSAAFEKLAGVASSEPDINSMEFSNSYFGQLWTASAPDLEADGSRSVSVKPGELDTSTLDFGGFSENFLPLNESLDVPFRELTRHEGNSGGQVGEKFFKIPRSKVVGRYDPTKVSQGTDLASVPLSLYSPSSLTGADTASKAALKDGQLAPNGSMLGYAQEPPMMLTTIDAMSAFTAKDAYPTMSKAAKAPIGSIRVRVAGAVGIDALSRERVRKVAQSITDRTGLAVDIVIGSSPTPVTVALPAGKFGRPALSLEEGWVLKGVGVALLQAVDRKSIALFGLILGVCALFMANATSAAVRSRRTELGILSSLGWSRSMIFRSILGELALVGLAAGALGAALAWPIGHLAGLAISPWRAALAIPAAVLLAVAAGLVPARVAAQHHPAEALRPATLNVGRARRPRGVAGLAMANLRRVPARAFVGALSLGIGVCALTVLLSITRAFNGAAVGSLLGDAITLQVRGVDYVAVVATIALGAVATADVLYLAIRERAGEFAALRAMGWTERSLLGLVAWEGLVMAAIGSLVGAAVGLGLTAWFTSALPTTAWVTAALAAGIGIVVALAALIVPAAALRRLPTAAVLAEEA